MKYLEFQVEGQHIKRVDNERPVAKCRSLYRAKFDFLTPEWKGQKTALFKMGKTPRAMLLDESNECEVPWEFFDVSEHSTGTVSVFCGNLVTVDVACVPVQKSGYTTMSEATVPPTPTIYEQLINVANDTRQIAQSVRNDADAGKFDGAKGDKGDKGEQGLQGLRGEKGEKGATGNTGESAYQVAVRLGFKGAEQEWIASLRYDHSDEFVKLAEQVRTTIANEGKKQTDAVTNTGNTAVKKVTDTGTVEVTKVTTEGAKQLKAVQDAVTGIVADRQQIQTNATNVSRLKEDLTKLDTIFFVKKRTSQLFDSSQKSLGNLYVKADLSVINSNLCLESWIVPVEANKRYLIYNKDKSALSLDTYYESIYFFENMPSAGIYAKTSIGSFTNSSPKNHIGYITKTKGYIFIILRKQSGVVVTQEQIDYVKSHTGCEQIDAGNFYDGLPYEIEEVAFDTKAEVDSKISKNQWTGRTILWMGTSIPEGKDTALESGGNGKPYPQMVAEELGAKCVNIALGSSMIRANTRFGDYTDGYSHNVLRAFSATLEEKENLIANWDTIRRKLRDPDTYMTLTTTDKENCRNSSYERLLMPYLDGTNPMPDLFVIDHGHNDYKYTLSDGSTDIGIPPNNANIGGGKEIAFDSNMFDGIMFDGLEKVYGSLAKMNEPTTFKYSVNRNCYWGAVNFICTLIYKYNPRARIVFVGNLDDKQHAGLCDAQVAIARDWCSPLIRMWEKLGFGRHYIPGTYNYWGESGLDLSQKDIYCKDKTHPFSDTTGEAMRLYADILANELKNCF